MRGLLLLAAVSGCGGPTVIDYGGGATSGEDGLRPSPTRTSGDGASGSASTTGGGGGSTGGGVAEGCGDGVVDPDEGCDDGNRVDGDGCSAACVATDFVVWEDEVSGTTDGNDIAATIAVDLDGNVVAVGTVRDTVYPPYYGSTSGPWVRKYGAAGDVLWTTRPGIGGTARDVAILPDGRIFIVGFAGPPPGSSGDTAFVLCLSVDGDLLWSDVFLVDEEHWMARARRAAVVDGTRVLVAGYERTDTDPGETFTWLRDYGPDGQVQLERREDPMTGDLRYPDALASDGVHVALLVGDWLQIYDEAGTQLAVVESIGDETHPDICGIDFDGDGNVVVIGTAWTQDEPREGGIWATTYAPDGSIVGELRVTEPLVSITAEAAALDASGAVLVTGYTYPAAYERDILLARYGTDGTRTWSRITDGGPGDGGDGVDLAIDPDGHPVVIADRTRSGEQLNIWVGRYHP